MSRCCRLTRREFLRWAGLVAATPLVIELERTAAAATSPMVAINLELVTLTETRAVLTWFTGDPSRPDAMGRLAPVAADTEVLVGTSSGGARVVYHDPSPTPYHYAEITDLEPGRTYFYAARSNGIPAIAAISANGNLIGSSTLGAAAGSPAHFTTPHAPPGDFLFAVALCNDLHLGETVAGLATTVRGVEVPPGIEQEEGLPPYAEVMAQALSIEARERGANFLLAAGDISSEASQMDVGDAKSYLDGFGTYEADYFVTRGNHDRPHTGSDVEACSAVPGSDGYHDCFRDAFFPGGPTWFTAQLNGLRILGLDTYDKIGGGGDNGVMSNPQFAFVRDELAADPERPTLVFGHHPVSLESHLTTVGEPLGVNLETRQGLKLERLYAAAPGVFLHHAGHTHRNKRTVSPVAGGVVFQEVAAVKEYPGGFHLLRLFTGGYALNFYKFKSPLAQQWSERSRPEYLGLAPFYLFGNTSDRNAVFERDLSGVAAVT